MIVATGDLGRLADEVSMVDGGFDPIHPGHLDYFEAAAELGSPVFCNVSSDDWVSRKHPPLLEQSQRARVIDAFRVVAYTHAARGTTEAVLRALRPRRYVKGADWRERLPVEQITICAELDIEIVFLETVTDSSTQLLRRYSDRSGLS